MVRGKVCSRVRGKVCRMVCGRVRVCGIGSPAFLRTLPEGAEFGSRVSCVFRLGSVFPGRRQGLVVHEERSSCEALDPAFVLVRGGESEPWPWDNEGREEVREGVGGTGGS